MSLKNNHLVSILIAVYNESLYIEDCVNSLLDQDYPNIEIIIVDDFSNDNTFKSATKLAQENPSKIQVYRNKVKGKAAAFSLAFEKSSGSILTLIGGDDTATNTYITSRLEAYLNLLSKKSSSENICILGKLKSFSENPKYNNIITPKSIKECNNFSGGLMMFSRSLGVMAFPVPSELPSEDGWVGLHAKYFSERKCVDNIILNYRIHTGNTIDRNANFENASTRISKRRKAEVLFYKKYKKDLNDKQQSQLKADISIEELRSSGKLLQLFMIKNVTLSAKLRAISYSNKYIYYIRMKFFSLFSGI